jgi:hypothetical protein
MASPCIGSRGLSFGGAFDRRPGWLGSGNAPHLLLANSLWHQSAKLRGPGQSPRTYASTRYPRTAHKPAPLGRDTWVTYTPKYPIPLMS